MYGWSCSRPRGTDVNLHTKALTLSGPAGLLEALVDTPPHPAPGAGTVVIAHPHPLFGGTMNNKVVQTLARAFVHTGWSAIRFNFRGVGASEGQYDHGVGEVDDMAAVLAQVGPADQVVALAGFSFGAFVAASTLARIGASRLVRPVVLVGTAASRFAVPEIAQELRSHVLVIHGEQDETVPLAAVLDWARPQGLPVTVVPGGEHFFHGQLNLLKSLVSRHLVSEAAVHPDR
jgi:alpha/beta superfamily hydrolase